MDGVLWGTLDKKVYNHVVETSRYGIYPLLTMVLEIANRLACKVVIVCVISSALQQRALSMEQTRGGRGMFMRLWRLGPEQSGALCPC